MMPSLSDLLRMGLLGTPLSALGQPNQGLLGKIPASDVPASGLLAPGMDRLPRRAFDYLQLVGPAILAALAAVAVMVVSTDAGPRFQFGLAMVT